MESYSNGFSLGVGNTSDLDNEHHGSDIYGVPEGSKSTEVVHRSVYAYFSITRLRLNIDVHVYI